MPTDPEPPELARLLDFAERPRVDDWSFRAALVRYACPEPARVGNIVETIRRTEHVLGRDPKQFVRDGPALWSALTGGGSAVAGADRETVALLELVVELDRLGEVVATWAVDLAGAPPNDDVDRVITDVATRLDELGVPREEREDPRRRRP